MYVYNILVIMVVLYLPVYLQHCNYMYMCGTLVIMVVLYLHVCLQHTGNNLVLYVYSILVII